MWLPGPSVAIVTGASTGIGYNVVQDLVRFYDGTVYMTCINETAGKKALVFLLIFWLTKIEQL